MKQLDNIEEFYCVVGPNTNSTIEGRIPTMEEAVKRATYWAEQCPGEQFYVMKQVGAVGVHQTLVATAIL